jgi:hypothetical protein
MAVKEEKGENIEGSARETAFWPSNADKHSIDSVYKFQNIFKNICKVISIFNDFKLEN